MPGGRKALSETLMPKTFLCPQMKWLENAVLFSWLHEIWRHHFILPRHSNEYENKAGVFVFVIITHNASFPCAKYVNIARRYYLFVVVFVAAYRDTRQLNVPATSLGHKISAVQGSLKWHHRTRRDLLIFSFRENDIFFSSEKYFPRFWFHSVYVILWNEWSRNMFGAKKNPFLFIDERITRMNCKDQSSKTYECYQPLNRNVIKCL